MTAAASMSAAELLARLERHYIPPQPLPGGVFVPEVGLNGTGRQARCDAIYVGFTSTSGRHMVGHELKVSRGDWLHELAQPGKADFWHDACHEWYVVTPFAGVVRPEEVPHGWGLLTVNPRTKTRLDRVVKAIQKPDGYTPPWLAVRSVFSRLDTLRAERAEQELRDLTAKAERAASRDAALAVERRLTDEERAARSIVQRVAALTANRVVWAYTDPDLIAAAIVDRLAVTRQARQLSNELAQTARLVNMDRLAELIADISEAAATARAAANAGPPRIEGTA